MISSSQFACKAAGIGPDPELPKYAGEKATACVFCGAPISRREPFEQVKFGAKFADHLSLAAPDSDLGCWGCHQARKTENGMLQVAAKAVYTRRGVFKAHSRAEQAYHLYEPPKDRFLWVHSLAQNEHMVWRTPLALDRDRFPVRVGPHLLTIDRPRTFAVLKLWRAAVEAVRASDKKHEKFVQPCESLDGDMKDASSLRIKGWVARLALPEVDALRQGLAQLSTGDAWALSVLVLYHNVSGWDARPERPERMFV